LAIKWIAIYYYYRVFIEFALNLLCIFLSLLCMWTWCTCVLHFWPENCIYVTTVLVAKCHQST